MKCPRCGADILETLEVCPSCNVDLIKDDPELARKDAEAKKRAKKAARQLKLLIFLVGFILAWIIWGGEVAGALLGLVVFFGAVSVASKLSWSQLKK